MAQTTNISNLNINQELSIQVSLSGLSFCILHKDSNTITYTKHIAFENKVNPIELLDKLKHAFNTEDVLNETFSAVNVIHVNDLSSLVPKPLFNEDYLADYLKFNSKILKSDFQELVKISNDFDGIVTDLPYGRSSKASEKPEEILKRFISIIPKNKKIAVMYQKELDPKMKLKGLKKYQIYRHKSLTRTILIK